MKRTLFGLVVVLLSLSVILTGCSGPFDAENGAIGRNAAVPEQKLVLIEGFSFFCNGIRGNVSTEVFVGLRFPELIKRDNAVTLVRIGNTTEWYLDTWDILCKTCERRDWVTFSDRNGVISNRIQANHPAVPRVQEPVPPALVFPVSRTR